MPKDEPRRKMWIDAAGFSDKDLINKNIFVCSDHFLPRDYEYTGSHLKKDSFPKTNLKFEQSASYFLCREFKENLTTNERNININFGHPELTKDSAFFK